jgi:hypothetical protein
MMLQQQKSSSSAKFNITHLSHRYVQSVQQFHLKSGKRIGEQGSWEKRTTQS